MTLLLAIIFLWYMIFGEPMIREHRTNKYPTNRVDFDKLRNDKITNNLSAAQVQRNMLNGKYDKR